MLGDTGASAANKQIQQTWAADVPGPSGSDWDAWLPHSSSAGANNSSQLLPAGDSTRTLNVTHTETSMVLSSLTIIRIHERNTTNADPT